MRLPKNSIMMFGLPRSGTTWASEALTAAVDGRLVNEPFNFLQDRKWRAYLYRYIRKDEATSEMDTHLENKVTTERRRIGRWQAIWHYNKPFVIKEVHLLFTAGYFWARYQPHMLVLLRHPCGVAQSLERLRWPAPSDFVREVLEQEEMVEEFLGDLVQFIKPQADYYSSIGLWWGVMNQVLVGISAGFSQCQVVTHEGLCPEPVDGFRGLLKAWGIKMSGEGQEFLSSYDRQPEHGESTYRPARKSRLEPNKWKTRMSKGQIEAVVRAASQFPVYERFYGD